MSRIAPVVKLYYNPWPATLADGVVLQILETAAIAADERLLLMMSQDWAEGRLTPDRDSFGAVLLNPVQQRGVFNLRDRVFASIVLGSKGADYLINGLAKADAHDRNGKPNGFFVDHANFCLGDGDFAWGSSAEFNCAIGGGSGLFPSQDEALVQQILEDVMFSVHDRRRAWLEERRRDGSHGWYNPDNDPSAEYAFIHTIGAITVDR